MDPKLKKIIQEQVPSLDERLSDLPPDVAADIKAGKAMFERAIAEGPQDEHYERIMNTLEDVIVQIDEEKKASDGYLFDQAEFIDACEHVLEDQRSALRGDKLNHAEFALRFNRWFVFCDGVVQLGISCLYPKEVLKDKDYEAVFKTLKVNKQFETLMLKPRGIKVEFRHKSKQVMEKYPWLAMPVLVLKDEHGVEHEIAITPSPNAAVWWLDILASFHGSYNWVIAPQFNEDEEDVPTSSIDQPYPEGTIREEEHALDEQFCLKAHGEEADETEHGVASPENTLRHFGVLSTINTVNKDTATRRQPIRAIGETEQRFPLYERPVYTEPKLSWWKRLWNKVRNFFS